MKERLDTVRLVRINALHCRRFLIIFQDCCTFQSEEIGQGMLAVEERKRAWVLASWQVVIDRYPMLGEKITALTKPYAFKGFTGMRNFVLEGENGERLAYVELPMDQH